ncbi:polysaccharide deacetylase family protein [Kocuria flava]|uniref:polysaccharide deacetylase family protein n=1 Tax=Kocuria flava TaxID=446860 RepID=UPI001FF4827C|nr:polysaccharide deacetylase family protein [Kocuria flava]MCJ8504327.1 polysaccharide deacetylase family protein [Kocuria flava]MCJ8504346.1 polysaccharide deacetylase family protein [Kocuria flava]
MARERGRLRRILLNPLVVVSLVVAVITSGWMLYTAGPDGLAHARPGSNLLPPIDATTEGALASSGSAASADPTGGWDISRSGDARASVELVEGQVRDDSRALKLEVTEYASGDVTLTSPRVEVEPDETYLFKAFTTTSADFTMLARLHHTDGSVTLEQLPNQLERPGTSPFTVSDAFDSADTVTAVQYVFRLASTGTLTVEGAYLEAAEDVRLPAAAATGPNLVPNPELTGPPTGAPDAWSVYTSGTSTVESGRGQDEAGSFLWTRIADYQDGEAKWEYQPIPVTPDRHVEFGATYRSEREVDVVAEFVRADGERKFQHLATVPPAGEWTRIRSSFQVPEGATAAVVTLVAQGNGTTGVRDYSLVDVTQEGPLRWDRPMVSISFDDGWQSIYDHALPLMDEHGFRSTQYVNPSSLETPDFMTADEIRHMHEAGHEIAAHSHEHVDLSAIGAGRLEEQMRKGDEMLEEADLGTDNLAPPYGRSDPQVDWYASRHYDIVRGTKHGINTRQKLDTHDLKVYYVTNETTQDELAAALAETSRVNGWLILVYHQVADADSTDARTEKVLADRNNITTDVFADQLRLIDESGIEVQPVAPAFEQLQGP